MRNDIPDLTGPDPVAMVMDIEERFDITIPDKDAECITNMGQLYDYIHARAARGQTQICVTSPAFYRLRRALGEVCGVARTSVRTETKLEDLVPLDGRRNAWQELQVRLGDYRLPALCRPEWLERRIDHLTYVPFLLGVSFGSLLAALGNAPAVPLLWFLAFPLVLAVGVGGPLAVYHIAYRRTVQYAVHLSPSCATVRDLVYVLVGRQAAGSLVSDTARPGDKAIWRLLCAIVGDELGRPPDSFTRESPFF